MVREKRKRFCFLFSLFVGIRKFIAKKQKKNQLL